ncbi:MAG TPA: hypothetical protein PKJ16_10950 [Spirochaetota bacterium]|nr:hypothetical protein [Spirochaetota bacterium]HPU88104.1 hypothetical protein [Spirochaetota bacterium]
MKTSQCENCTLRKKYDTHPQSLLGRFWKWHIRFCPGWKSYLKSVPVDVRDQLFERYGRRAL